MSDAILYKVVTIAGGVDGKSADKGGKTKFASFDRYEAEKKLDSWSELKLEVIENIEAAVARKMAALDPVDFLLLEKGFHERWLGPARQAK
jgi:hypothetical protein